MTRRSSRKSSWSSGSWRSDIGWLRRLGRQQGRRASEFRPSPRHPLSSSALECAEISGFDDVRFWGDVYSKDFERILLEKNRQVLAAAETGVSTKGLDEANFLAISGGGDKGAFAAGVLAGWTQRGDRPIFEAVTGVSAGALASPFAFLGSDYDNALLDIYTKLGGHQLYRSRGLFGFFGDALNDTSRLEAVIRKHATDEFLDRIAAEHMKGRRLFVLTTNLDAQRQVIWNMSGIAATGRDDRRDLFVQVLRASSALPGLFPPVKIDVQGPDGKTYDELHVDGGVTAEVIFVPPESKIRDIERRVFAKGRTRALFVIENSKLSPEYNAVEPKLVALAARAVSTVVKYQVIDNLLSLSMIAEATHSRFCFNAIPNGFDIKSGKLFDLGQARALFECGQSVGRSGDWATEVPLSPVHAMGKEGLGIDGEDESAVTRRCLRAHGQSYRRNARD